MAFSWFSDELKITPERNRGSILILSFTARRVCVNFFFVFESDYFLLLFRIVSRSRYCIVVVAAVKSERMREKKFAHMID